MSNLRLGQKSKSERNLPGHSQNNFAALRLNFPEIIDLVQMAFAFLFAEKKGFFLRLRTKCQRRRSLQPGINNAVGGIG